MTGFVYYITTLAGAAIAIIVIAVAHIVGA